jgi:hypothetical protein
VALLVKKFITSMEPDYLLHCLKESATGQNTKPDESNQFLICILILLLLSFNICLCLSGVILSSGVSTHILYALHKSFRRATSSAHLIRFYFIIITIPDEEYKL